LETQKIDYTEPKLPLLVHGGQSFLKKLEQNFLLTMKDSKEITLLLLYNFSQECQLLLGLQKSLQKRAMIIFGKL